MYPIGDVKYDRSSLCAIVSVLRMGGFLSGRRCLRGFQSSSSLVRRQRQEDFLEAQVHRPQLQQSPSTADYRPGEIASEVVAALALHFVSNSRVAPIRFGDPRDARDALERTRRVGAVRVHLDIQ